MSNKALIRGTSEAWEKGGQLGNDKAHAKRAPAALEAAVEEALGLQAISIRLPRSTIQAYKDMAEVTGIGYQPLMRDAICRWVESEMKQMLAGAAQTKRREVADAAVETPPVKRQRAA
ncbi:hypothetical protein [Paucibacter sp. M5-1]|uniref:hypothetical protein n=1 Tax=Paucibacter sp. M5-1 TaxID=3015998 RepID=UPI0022B8E4F8|nr:hypothetical protein [Paucibacter sp. M5-1]MCZ7883776.1 hypothetical protein [Paucibacter sp. M5-1]